MPFNRTKKTKLFKSLVHLQTNAAVDKATVSVYVCKAQLSKPSVQLLLGAPANQSGAAPLQVAWGLEKNDITHSFDPFCQNKE